MSDEDTVPAMIQGKSIKPFISQELSEKTRMKLWILNLIDPKSASRAMPGIVVRARSARAARALVASAESSEGRAAWLDASMTSCSELKAEGEPDIVLRSCRFCTQMRKDYP